MTDVSAALQAVGNPTRRAVLELLAGGEQTVGQLTDELPVTQGAVSQHLKVLHDAGLVSVRPEGRRRLYSVDLGGMGQVRAWVDGFWDGVLAAFVDHVNADDHVNDHVNANDDVRATTGEQPTVNDQRSES